MYGKDASLNAGPYRSADKPMWLSRYPNKGFVQITGLLNEDPVDVRGTKGDRVGKFNYDDQRINAWKSEKDAWVSGYWFWDWSEQWHKIANIDTEKKIIKVAPPYHGYGYRVGFMDLIFFLKLMNQWSIM